MYDAAAAEDDDDIIIYYIYAYVSRLCGWKIQKRRKTEHQNYYSSELIGFDKRTLFSEVSLPLNVIEYSFIRT